MTYTPYEQELIIKLFLNGFDLFYVPIHRNDYFYKTIRKFVELGFIRKKIRKHDNKRIEYILTDDGIVFALIVAKDKNIKISNFHYLLLKT